MKAIYKQKTLAESAEAIQIEKDFYFPVESVTMDYLEKHERKGACENQGDACYYDIRIDGNVIEDGASSFSRNLEASEEMKNFIVFNPPIDVVP